MLRINDLKLPLEYTDADIEAAIRTRLKIGSYDILSFEVIKDSIDARFKNDICRCVSVAASLRGEKRFENFKGVTPYRKYVYEYPPASRLSKRPVVVGSGPAGLFAALILARCGAQPILIERGLDADSRREKVDLFFKNRSLDSECNIQFGEGGAGTFSDGKLNTGTKDFRQRKVLEEFIACGAPGEIAIAGKPHIGTDNLITVVKNMRRKIIECGGEVRFSCKLENIYTENGKLCAVKTSCGDIDTDTLVLATGHSARDTFRMLSDNKILMQRKSFSMGVRIEHPQSLINESLYHNAAPLLPAADYKAAVHLKDGRGVYTFCMCPGGTVVAASSEENTVVTNGMSNFARDGQNSNSALLVSILPTDFPDDDIFSGVKLQQKLEKAAFFLGGANYNAPVQTVADFLNKQKSVSLGNVEPTYPIGVTPSDLSKILPPFIDNSLREAIGLIDRKIHGFALPDAVLTAVESRSSSPVRILRDESMQASVRGIYPCGEGAGYAGGIMSAAVDGIRVAEAILGKNEGFR